MKKKEMKLYIIYNGTLSGPKEAMVNSGKGFDFNLNYQEQVQIPVMSFLLDHPDGLVLFDSGISTNTSIAISGEQNLIESLAKIGFSPDDVKYVVCSHLHIDHAGYLKHFKKSEIIVEEAEYKNVIQLYEKDELPAVYVKKDVEEWLEADLNWRLISGDHEVSELLKGVKIINLGSGHSYGMLSLLIEQEASGNKLLVSDAIYCQENIGPPVKPPGIIQDVDGYKKSVAKILELAKKHDAQIWS